jgi:pSer/pThr/pTyr-binding forkhead associated (FHA) protein
MAEYKLVVRKGPAPGKTFELTQKELTIGRDINNEIAINDPEISRRHCRLVQQAEGYTLEDLGSTNGTFVNEKRISGTHTLRHGESVRVGENVILVFEMIEDDPDATLASRGVRAQVQAPPEPQAPPRQPKKRKAGPAFTMPNLRDNRTLLIGCGALLVVGICVVVGGLWYIDANYLWCDVFGGLLANCP